VNPGDNYFFCLILECVSPPVSESLAYHASDGLIGPVLIVHAQPNAVAVAEIKLCQIAVQVHLRSERAPLIFSWNIFSHFAAFSSANWADKD
jgi:hypothetical protein